MVLQAKRLRDESDYEMLELVKSTAYYELSDMFNVGIDGIVWNAYDGGGNFASTYASESSAAIATLERIVESFESE